MDESYIGIGVILHAEGNFSVEIDRLNRLQSEPAILIEVYFSISGEIPSSPVDLDISSSISIPRTDSSVHRNSLGQSPGLRVRQENSDGDSLKDGCSRLKQVKKKLFRVFSLAWLVSATWSPSERVGMEERLVLFNIRTAFQKYLASTLFRWSLK